jgi:hypothetical protein
VSVTSWGIPQVGAAILAYWLALFLAIRLFALIRLRRANRGQRVIVEPVDGSAADRRAPVRHVSGGLQLEFSESINLPLVLFVLLGPPLALVLFRYWLGG